MVCGGCRVCVVCRGVVCVYGCRVCSGVWGVCGMWEGVYCGCGCVAVCRVVWCVGGVYGGCRVCRGE